jgi:mono/diheme cytochrome c family protein
VSLSDGGAPRRPTGRAIAIGLALAVLAALGGVTARGLARLDARADVTPAEVPTPWPLDEAELARIREELTAAWIDRNERQRAATAAMIGSASSGPSIWVASEPPPADLLAGVDLDALARQRALTRGEHLVRARAGCLGCHGDDLGGAVLADDLWHGRVVAPDLTPSGPTADWSTADWVRLLRHGRTPDGRHARMPGAATRAWSDRDLSDAISWLRSLAPTDRAPVAPRLGPALVLGVGLGLVDLPDADAPPPVDARASLGARVSDACKTCHGDDLRGGRVPFAPLHWPDAPALMGGMTGWDAADFAKLLETGIRPDGTRVGAGMPVAMTRALTPEEQAALWTWLRRAP